jgi:hypothetical protein
MKYPDDIPKELHEYYEQKAETISSPKCKKIKVGQIWTPIGAKNKHPYYPNPYKLTIIAVEGELFKYSSIELLNDKWEIRNKESQWLPISIIIDEIKQKRLVNEYVEEKF